MKVIETKIPEIKIIEPTIFEDERGTFFESFNQKKFQANFGGGLEFVQDNHSCSKKGVFRGLHYQIHPNEQSKLVRVVKGKIFDIALDLRRTSPTFGNWVGEFLSSENKRQLWIPKGFAHGFLTLSETAEVVYKVTKFYAPDSEAGINFESMSFLQNIVFRGKIILNDKDRQLPHLKEFKKLP